MTVGRFRKLVERIEKSIPLVSLRILSNRKIDRQLPTPAQGSPHRDPGRGIIARLRQVTESRLGERISAQARRFEALPPQHSCRVNRAPSVMSSAPHEVPVPTGPRPGHFLRVIFNERRPCGVDVLAPIALDRVRSGKPMTPPRPSPRCSHHVRMRRAKCGGGAQSAQGRRLSSAQPAHEPAVAVREAARGGTAGFGPAAARDRATGDRALHRVR